MTTKTQKVEQAQTVTQTDVMERTNVQQQTIAGAVTEMLLLARTEATEALTQMKKANKAKGECQSRTAHALWALAKDGREYVRNMVLPEDATDAQKEQRESAIRVACADLGYTAFATPEAKKRTFVDADAKLMPNVMRAVAPLVVRMLDENVTPVIGPKGLMKVPAKLLLDETQTKDPDYKEVLDRPVTLDAKAQEGPHKYTFVKSFARAIGLAADKQKAVNLTARKPAGQTGESAAPVDYKFSPTGAIEAAVFLTKYLQNRLAVGDAKPSRELRSELNNLFACLAKYNGAADEEVKHIDPKVADMILASATKGN